MSGEAFIRMRMHLRRDHDGVMRMNKRIFVAGTASLLSFLLCSCGLFESGSDVPPPPAGEEWSAKIKSSYPDWQPPHEMPMGTAEYQAALKAEREQKASAAAEPESGTAVTKAGPESVAPEKSVSSAAQEKIGTEDGSKNAKEIPSVYLVKQNDNLWNIAKSIYGKGEKWTVIFEANKEKIKNPDILKPGLELQIPPAGK